MRFYLYIIGCIILQSCLNDSNSPAKRQKIETCPVFYEIKDENLKKELRHLFQTQVSDFPGEDSIMVIYINRNPSSIDYFIRYENCSFNMEEMPNFFAQIDSNVVAVNYGAPKYALYSTEKYIWGNLKQHFPMQYKDTYLEGYILIPNINEQSVTWHLTFKDNICIKREKLIQ